MPPGFATTAAAYRCYLRANDIDGKLRNHLDAYHAGNQSLAQTGAAIRQLIVNAEFPPEIAGSILASHRALAKRCGTADLAVAVRSSATAEDLPQASFAGQQETFLNVRGESDLLLACRKCYASLFTDRAIVYRETNGFDHLQVALSIGIQKMVRADRAGAGVAFTLDTETGFPGVVVVSATWGLGENVVQGTVTPDKYLVFKQLLQEEKYWPIIEKSLGAKEKKLVYGEDGGASPSVPRSRPCAWLCGKAPGSSCSLTSGAPRRVASISSGPWRPLLQSSASCSGGPSLCARAGLMASKATQGRLCSARTCASTRVSERMTRRWHARWRRRQT